MFTLLKEWKADEGKYKEETYEENVEDLVRLNHRERKQSRQSRPLLWVPVSVDEIRILRGQQP